MTAYNQIAVVGAGANGGAIAAALTDAGATVTAFDPWVELVERVRERGLTVRSGLGERTSAVRMKHLCELAESLPQFDLIVLGVKAYDTRWVCELLRPHLRDNGAVVAVQNGITLDTVSAVFGQDRSVGAVIEVAANMFEPGFIEQEAPMWLALGGEDPVAQAHATRIAPLLQCAATVTVTDDIRSAKWMKLVANACELVPSAILNLPLEQAIALPGMYEFMLATGQEALQVALSQHQRIVPIFPGSVDASVLTPEKYVDHLLGIVLSDYTLPTTLTTVLQDWRKGRRAEIEQLNGEVVRRTTHPELSRRNNLVLRLARQVEAGTLRSEPENLSLLLADR